MYKRQISLLINLNNYFAADSIDIHSCVLLKNKNNLIPLKNLDTLHIASLNISTNSANIFENSSDNYTDIKHFHFNTFSSKRMVKAMVKELENFNLIIVNTDTIHEFSANIIRDISKENKVILNYMGISNIPFEETINFSIFCPFFSFLILPVKTSRLLIFFICTLSKFLSKFSE